MNQQNKFLEILEQKLESYPVWLRDSLKEELIAEYNKMIGDDKNREGEISI